MPDRVLLEQVLLNLVLNSLQASQHLGAARRVVQIEAAREAELLVVRVADRGPGISPQVEAHLFEPFFTSKPDGLGLGLNICRTIIESHGGHLGHQNRAEGGAHLLLHPAPCNMKHPHLNIYIVDDDEDVRRSLVMLLHSQGRALQSFESGEAFLAQVDVARQAGCVVLDLRMQGISGIEVFDQLLARRSPLVVLFLSGHGDIQLAVEQVKKGASDWIPKPSTPRKCWPNWGRHWSWPGSGRGICSFGKA